MSGFLGSGDLYYNRVVAGVSQGWLRFGNSTKFEIKENATIKERKSKGKADYGQVKDSVGLKDAAEIAITLDDLDKDNLALAFLGDVSAINITGASASAEAHTANLGKSIQLDNAKVSAIVVQDVTDTTTYIEGTDYNVLSATLGLIEIIAGATIIEGAVLHIDYTYASVTGDKVKGGTSSSVKVGLLLDGENFADQSESKVTVWEAVLIPQTGVDFLSDDFATLELNGTLNTPSGKTSAYEVDTGLTYS